jgi:hypothetical protein
VKTFPHWRAVGRAMRWARQQEGVTVEPPTRGIPIRTRRYTGPADVVASVTTVSGSTWFKTFSGVVGSAHVHPNNAAEALRVLAALELIRADIAYAADERYGRCEVCGRLAQWVPPSGQFAARWCHLNPNRPYHRPEVADA